MATIIIVKRADSTLVTRIKLTEDRDGNSWYIIAFCTRERGLDVLYREDETLSLFHSECSNRGSITAFDLVVGMWSDNIQTIYSAEALGTTAFADLVKSVQSHYDPKQSKIMQRYKFNTQVRAEGESIRYFFTGDCRALPLRGQFV